MRDNITIEQKVIDAEHMVDYFLLGEDWVMNTLQAVQTAQGVGHDVERLHKWMKKKREDRSRKKQQQATGVTGARA